MENKYAKALLLIGFIAFVFSSGRWNIFITAWIWPFAFLYYERSCRTIRQFLPLGIAIVIGHVIKWYGLLGAGFLIDTLFCMVWSLTWVLPFVIDRLLYGKFSGILASLLFPSVFTSVEILRSMQLVGSFGSTAYTQTGILPLIQISSVVGSFGLSFIILWFGSVLTEVLREGITQKQTKRASAACAAVLIAVLAFGMVRVAAFSPSDSTADTVRVASVISPYYGAFSDTEFIELSYEETMEYLTDEAERAAEGGADIAGWNEEAFCIGDIQEEAFIEDVQSLAGRLNMTLDIPYEVEDTDDSEDGLSVNKLIVACPDGTYKEYIKTKLVPLLETTQYVAGTGDIPTVTANDVVLSSVICFDADYPMYIHGFGADTADNYLDTEILMDLSWDWEAVATAHTKGAEFRAIENGVSFVKPSYDGLSEAVDRQGRVLASFQTSDTGFDTVQFADVPAEKCTTIYERIETVMDIALCGFGILMFLAGILMSLKKRSSAGTASDKIDP